MNYKDLLRAWGSVLAGRRPSLSIEITHECPLRCPGCYAYQDNHVGDGINLRQLADKKDDALVQGVLRVVDYYQPLHLSIVGGDPLVRFRELDILLPQLETRGLHVQLVTGAFREIPKSWSRIRGVSIGLTAANLLNVSIRIGRALRMLDWEKGAEARRHQRTYPNHYPRRCCKSRKCLNSPGSCRIVNL